MKWATCNVGATSPEGYGKYYAWGETSIQSTGRYVWNTYKYGRTVSNLTKYCTDSYYGTVDNKTELEPEDDAAAVNWGGAWRMYTYAELIELHKNCTITKTTDYNDTGIAGRIITSNINGNAIFLPAAGYRYDGSLKSAAVSGYYWSSSLFSSSRSAYNIFFSDVTDWFITNNDRCEGCSVRAVLNNKK
ncbi:MAG: hypothetical protein ACI30B_08795 [Paludibacteraceae bacterium]